jgi:hypothetical protein
MGNSASATLFYGYAFDNENVWPWQSEEEEAWEEYESYSDRDWDTEHFYIHKVLGKTEAEVDAMGWEERSKHEKSMLCEVASWGYLDGQSCYFIHPRDERACIHASWDGPETIDPAKMTPNPEWDIVLKEFAEKMGVILDGQEPAWHIVCTYG